MRFMVLLKATHDFDAVAVTGDQLLDRLAPYSEELARAGVLVAAEALHPAAEAVRVRMAGCDWIVVDEPFTPSSDRVAAFWLLQVRSIEEATEWVRRCPSPFDGGSEIDIRRIFEVGAFGVEQDRWP